MMMKLHVFFKHYWPSLLSGFLMGTSYIPLPPWALVFCWAPLWCNLLKENSLKRVFLKGWISQFILTLIGFHWIAYTAHEFGFLPWPVAVLVLLLYAAAMNLFIPLAVAIGWLLVRRFSLTTGSALVCFAALHVAGETFYPAIFPFNLGYPVIYAGLPIGQLADVVGVLGLSLLVHLLNAGIAFGWLAWKDQVSQKTALAMGFATAILLVVFHFVGSQHERAWLSTDSTVRVLQVQANIGNADKLLAEKGMGAPAEIVRRFFQLTEEGLAEASKQNTPVDLIIWPETAFPDFLGAHNSRRSFNQGLMQFIQKINTPLLTGAYGNDPPISVGSKMTRHEYNSLFLYDPLKLDSPQHYFKTYLLVFGEYVPFGDTFPILKKWNPGGAGWGGRGSGPITLDLRGLKIGPEICYEGLYPEFSRSLVLAGADVLVNLTNDSWFGAPFEPYQHMYMTMARAIENRRPMIRSTNTGVTAVTLASGKLLNPSPLHEAWYGLYDVNYRAKSPLTFFTRYGAFFPLVILATLLIALGIGGNFSGSRRD